MSEKSYVHGQAGPGFGTNDLGTSFWYGAGIGIGLGKKIDAELKYTGWKQGDIVASTTGTNTNTNGDGGIYGGTQGGTGTTTTTTPPAAPPTYGGYYSTIGLRLAYKF